MKKPQIISRPDILGGKPIIAGTRIPVSLVLGILASGMTEKEILTEYPTLTKASIQAALEFASKRLENETVRPVKRDAKGAIVFA